MTEPTARIAIDRSQPLAAEPATGHNRWHPDIPPILTVDPGEIVEIETRDAYDGQIAPGMFSLDLARLDGARVHPLTGPVAIRGAEPGDLLEVEILDVAAAARGFTILSPLYGVLRGAFAEPFLAHWEMRDGVATSPQVPGVRIPAAPFLGVMGVAPSSTMLEAFTVYERRLEAERAAPPPVEPEGAVPPVATQGLRTIPPRDNGGNIDVTQLTAGATLRLPVFVEGALFSTGDAHFAQGDNECCTAIEMGATLRCRFALRKGEAERRGVRDPQFLAAPQRPPRRWFGVTGQSFSRDGALTGNDLTTAAKNALVNMIDHLGHERGYSREQAAVICSVAVDLKISQAANNPNYIVSALLPLDILDA